MATTASSAGTALVDMARGLLSRKRGLDAGAEGSELEAEEAEAAAQAETARLVSEAERARLAAEAAAEANRLATEASRVAAAAEARLAEEEEDARMAAEAQAEAAALAEGLMLVPSDTTGGFKGVKKDKNLSTRPYYAQIKENGHCKSLGYFATAKEAALAYARAKGLKASAPALALPAPSEPGAAGASSSALVAVGEGGEVGEVGEGGEPSEADKLAAAEGLILVPAPGSASGYKGVKHHKDKRHRTRPYEARITVSDKTRSLGRFASAKEAALAYARAKAGRLSEAGRPLRHVVAHTIEHADPSELAEVRGAWLDLTWRGLT
jgi:hypothetical protein